jgi:hypothetical protein
MAEVRMKRLMIFALLVSSAGVAATAQAADSAPTFSKDVAPILYERCVGCHRPGEVAPMSLISYTDVRPWVKAIRAKVVSREMPPWHSDPRYGAFRNDPSLTQAQIDTIAKWVDAGAPKGNDQDMPAAPTFADGWQGGTPDYIFEIPETPVPAEGEIPNDYVWVENPFKEDIFVSAMELRPGNRAVVHHLRIDVVKLPDGHKVVNGILYGPDGKRAALSGGGASDVIAQDGERHHLIAWVPGRTLEKFRPGTGKRIAAGHWIRFNTHYQPNGTATTDRSKLGIWLSKTPVTHEVFTRGVGSSLPTDPDETRFTVNGKEIVVRSDNGEVVQAAGAERRGIPNIPPYAENWKIAGVTAITQPITLYVMSPHMHLRGKDMVWIATYPDGREETLLSVPKYDFNWQLNYELKTPLTLPAGSKITAVAHYDNSVNNRYNPGPDKEVYWAEQSWDEMFLPYLEYTVDNHTTSTDKPTQQQR